MMTLRKGACAALLGISLFVCPDAYAANFSFTGNFTQDDNIQFFDFTVGSPSAVTLVTYSYAGSAGADYSAIAGPGVTVGTNAAGQVIARGGFDPILAVFDPAGNNIAQNDDGHIVTDSVSGVAWDTFLTTAVLAPGTYRVAVMEYDNFAPATLAGLWQRQGAGNFTSGNSLCVQTAFCDVSNSSVAGVNRDSHWAFDVLNADQAVVIPNETPIPGALPLFASGLGVLGFIAHRRKRKTLAV